MLLAGYQDTFLVSYILLASHHLNLQREKNRGGLMLVAATQSEAYVLIQAKSTLHIHTHTECADTVRKKHILDN